MVLCEWGGGQFPINQRGQNIVTPGVICYSDPGVTQAGSVCDGYYVVHYYDNNPSVFTFTTTGGDTWYFKSSDILSGYYASGYTIDRWASQANPNITSVESDGLRVKKETAFHNIGQPFDVKESGLAGKTVTFSILSQNNVAFDARIIATTSNSFWSSELLDVRSSATQGITSVTATIPSEAKFACFMMSNDFTDQAHTRHYTSS